MSIEDIIALLAAITAFATPLFGIWRVFVYRDNKKQERRHNFAMAEQKAGRQAQIEQNALLVKILANGETSMNAVVDVINVFTKASVARDLMHEKEDVRHIEMMALLNETLSRGMKQNATSLQAFKDVFAPIGDTIQTIDLRTASVDKNASKTAALVMDSNNTIIAVRQEMEQIRVALDKLVSGNGSLVTHETAIQLQELFERKANDILGLLKSLSPLAEKENKGKSNVESTQPITTDI